MVVVLCSDAGVSSIWDMRALILMNETNSSCRTFILNLYSFTVDILTCAKGWDRKIDGWIDINRYNEHRYVVLVNMHIVHTMFQY